MANDFSDEHMVDLALAATGEPGSDAPCPTAGELASLREGTLPPARRAEVLAHLDTCPEGMTAWLAVSSVDESAPRLARVSRHKAVSPVFVRTVAGLVALAACLLLVLHFTPQDHALPDYVQAVNGGYETVLGNPAPYAGLISAAGELLASAETRSGETPAARAFADGWRSGLDELRQGKASGYAPSGNDRADYIFSTGRWSALVHAALMTDDVPGDFWPGLTQAVRQFRRQTSVLKPEDKDRLYGIWGDILATLERMDGNAPTAPDRDRLRRQLNGLGRIMADLDLGRE